MAKSRTDNARWMAMLVMALAGSALNAQSAAPQTLPVADWQTAAGGKMEFEVASVRLDKGPFRPPSFALSSDDWFREPNGRFQADFSVETYIEFAYKTWLSADERKVMLAGLPDWVTADRYAIEATAPLHATKDQYRLMMQALLAERFGLVMHFENREMPVLAMVLMKPGVPGPKLIPHDKGQACDDKPIPGVYPPTVCHGILASPKDGMVQVGSRAATIESIGQFLGSFGGGTGEIPHPVVDQTGLEGRWDFTLLMAMKFEPPKPDAPAPDGPTLLEAVQEQLGIKLKPTKATLRIPVVDKVERPTEN